jgi:hypothetical protein
MGLKTPILFIIFNRPDTTQQVFDAIRQAQPKQLFVAADGPREDKPSEAPKCQQTRDIIKQVDWQCEVRTLFQEKNLGCGPGPATAITWFFENVEEGIILEDDCLPSADFFIFCEVLLDYYRDNKKIMHISGDNFQYDRRRGKGSYYFSAWADCHAWGWATWRRAWKHFDFYCTSAEHRRTVWDWQWGVSVRNNGGLAIVPNINLVSNIGVGSDATHTLGPARYSNVPTQTLELPLVHPKTISRNRAADCYTYCTRIRGWDNVDMAGIIRWQIAELARIKTICKSIMAVKNILLSLRGSSQT